MNDILAVIDMQNDFIDGALGTKEAIAIVSNVVEKIKESNINDDLVIYTKDTHYENYLDTLEGKKLPVKHCIKDTNGWELNEEIQKLVNENSIIILKPTFGSLTLIEMLKKYVKEDTIIKVVGLCTDICVISNVLLIRATFPNNKIIVYKDCCAGVTPKTHDSALETMTMCQIDIV